MKKHLLVGIITVFVSASASNNPFDLEENFGKIDQDQKLLLGELKKVYDKKELDEEKALDMLGEHTVEEVVETNKNLKQENAKIDYVNIENISNAENKSQDMSIDKLDQIRQKALELSKKEASEKKESSNKLSKNTEKEISIKEVEKRDVEEYERQRAEKLAKQKELSEAEALEREALAQKEAKKKAKEAEEKKAKEAKKKAQEEKKKIKMEIENQKLVENEKLAKDKVVIKKKKLIHKITSVDDINITREKIEAKAAADKAYEEAVKEMSQED